MNVKQKFSIRALNAHVNNYLYIASSSLNIYIFKKMRFKVPLQVKQLRGVKKALKLCFFMFIYFSIHHPLLCSWYLEKITFCCDCIITS